jgi:hypothetical protein
MNTCARLLKYILVDFGNLNKKRYKNQKIEQKYCLTMERVSKRTTFFKTKGFFLITAVTCTQFPFWLVSP